MDAAVSRGRWRAPERERCRPGGRRRRAPGVHGRLGSHLLMRRAGTAPSTARRFFRRRRRRRRVGTVDNTQWHCRCGQVTSGPYSTGQLSSLWMASPPALRLGARAGPLAAKAGARRRRWRHAAPAAASASHRPARRRRRQGRLLHSPRIPMNSLNSWAAKSADRSTRPPETTRIPCSLACSGRQPPSQTLLHALLARVRSCLIRFDGRRRQGARVHRISRWGCPAASSHSFLSVMRLREVVHAMRI